MLQDDNFSFSSWIISTAQAYSQYHNFVASVLCVFGICMSTMFVCVLLRPSMRRCATNVILTGIACNDLVVRIATLIYLSVDPLCSSWAFTRPWMEYVRVYANVSVICHSCGLWLTVGMAALRYVVLTRNVPLQWTGCGEGVRIICGTWFGVLCGYALNMARHEINSAGRYPKPPDNCITSQNNNSDEVWRTDAYVMRERAWFVNYVSGVNYWLQAVLFKLIPCVCLAVFTCFLIRILCETKARRERLRQPQNGASNDNYLLSKKRPTNFRQETYKTALLVAIALVYLLTEAPQGFLTLYTGVLRAKDNSRAADDLYESVGDVADLLSLLQSTFNFLLYCLMSSQFRAQLFEMCGKRKPKTNIQTEYTNLNGCGVADQMNNRTVATTNAQLSPIYEVTTNDASHDVSNCDKIEVQLNNYHKSDTKSTEVLEVN